MSRDAPPNLRSLEKRIANTAKIQQRAERRIQRAVANTVVGQMLPPGVVKGGTAMKIRVGEAASRFTPDLDAARPADLSLKDYLEQLSDNLRSGWGGFTGTVEERNPPQPVGVPAEYITQPFAIKLSFMGRHWLTVTFELGRDEIGSTRNPEWRMADDIKMLFADLGLAEPGPIPLLAIEHQIAQKLHACTAVDVKTGRNERAHDLVDLQIIVAEEPIELQTVAATAQQLFLIRRSQPWPPTVTVYDRWETLYAEAADGLDVIPEVKDAANWANDFIVNITASTEIEEVAKSTRDDTPED